MKREHELTKIPDAELRRRLEVPIKNKNHDAAIERLQLMRERAFRDKWTKPPTRRPWTALADEAPPEDKPVLWWAPGGFIVPGPFMLVLLALCVSLMMSLRHEKPVSTLKPIVRKAVVHAEKYPDGP